MRVDKEQFKAVNAVREWISSRISGIRVSRGWSMREIANRLEIDESRVSDFEACRSDYKISTLLRFARSLNVTMDVLMRGCPGWTKAASKEQGTFIIIEGQALHDLLVSQGVSEKKAVEIVSLASARQ